MCYLQFYSAYASHFHFVIVSAMPENPFTGTLRASGDGFLVPGEEHMANILNDVYV